MTDQHSSSGNDEELYALRYLIASHMACEDECKAQPTGCGCALTAARAVFNRHAQSTPGPREILRSLCSAGGDLGCSCADRNYQWYGPSCEATMTSALRTMLKDEATSFASTPQDAPAQHMPDSPISAIHDALAAAGLEYSGYSCNGVNLVGDRASIKAAMAAFHSHGQIDQLKTHLRHWREECGKLHARLGTSSVSSTTSASPEQP